MTAGPFAQRVRGDWGCRAGARTSANLEPDSHQASVCTLQLPAETLRRKGTEVTSSSLSGLLQPSSGSLYYKFTDSSRRVLGMREQIFLIDGEDEPHGYHPLSTHSTRSRKAHPRVQLTDMHAAKLRLPVIDETSPEVTKVVFPGGRVNYVLMARRTSRLPALRALHEHMQSAGPRLDSFLSQLPGSRLVKDETAGGRYIASGFGTMGKSLPRSLRPPSQPALRQCLRLHEHTALAEVVGGVFSRVAECIFQHCDSVHGDNQELMKDSPGMVWPPLHFQKPGRSWVSSQFVVRRWGNLDSSIWPLEKETVAAHADLGDLDCTMFHCYTTGGGRRGRGGPVAGSDLAVFEARTGGVGYRVKTCVEDTVVVVVLNSCRQLHGCIRNRRVGGSEHTSWTTRIIPFITTGVHTWVTQNPGDLPFTSIP